MRAHLFLSTALVFALAGCEPNDGEAGPETDVFDDPQVMGLAVVLSDHQVQVAMGALQRGLQYPGVQAYAMQMIAEQSAARDRLLTIAQQENIAVDESTVEAKSHQTDTAEDIQLLQPPVEGTQVDNTYLADSLHDVGKAMTIYDATVLPNAKSGPMRDQLTTIRAMYTSELSSGMSVQAQYAIPPKMMGD